MNHRVLKTLEFDKVREHLSSFAGSREAERSLKELAPLSSLSEIEQALKETEDALNRLLRGGNISFSGIRDIRPHISRLSLGSALSAGELLEIASLLETADLALRFSKGQKGEEITDSLSPLFLLLSPLSEQKQKIRRIIPAADEIADDASPRLSSIRRKLKNMDQKIHDKINALLNNAEVRQHLQDPVVTTRDGRFCLPVKAEAKAQVPGLVHDHSGSGSTLFIEPMAVVQLNNEQTELLLEEKDEIAAILQNLSEEMSGFAEELNEDYKTLVSLDVIFAKAALAKEQNATRPLMNEKGRILLRKARHPLLSKDTVVPIDLSLGVDFDQLIITGPNTGGKTVSLKTVGLLTLMGLSGLLIPAGDRSELPVLSEVYADIGDEQSIELSLSTFSSHMKNIVYILKHAGRDSLVLFDELCAGTDPVEGAALASSILEEHHRRRTLTMATTHYSELKVYAMTHPLISNASLEFDVETLSPTYHLLIGIPGKSNAFAISEKLGLKPQVIAKAKEKLSENTKAFEDLIAELENSRKELAAEQQRIEELRKEADALQAKTQEKAEKLASQKERILSEAREEAWQILRDAKETADESIRNIRKSGNAASVKELEQEREVLRSSMKSQEDALAQKKKTEKKPHKVPKNLQIGDRVRVVSMNLTGTVHSLPNAKGELTVQMGILHSTVQLNDLELLPDEEPSYKKTFSQSNSSHIKHEKSMGVHSELNVIGKRSDEAVAAMEKYLDDAALAGLSSVRIVHGKGTGALRNAVWTRLKQLPNIQSYRLGEFGEGDAGVTIVELK